MTITLYLYNKTLLRDLQTLKAIFIAKEPELVQLSRRYLAPLNISTQESTKEETVTIQVSPEEFALIGIFNGVYK